MHASPLLVSTRFISGFENSRYGASACSRMHDVLRKPLGRAKSETGLRARVCAEFTLGILLSITSMSMAIGGDRTRRCRRASDGRRTKGSTTGVVMLSCSQLTHASSSTVRSKNTNTFSSETSTSPRPERQLTLEGKAPDRLNRVVVCWTSAVSIGTSS